MTRPPKTHILEGRTSAGVLIFACGRRVLVDAAPYVGRALVLRGERTEDVTCALCRRVYRLPELPK